MKEKTSFFAVALFIMFFISSLASASFYVIGPGNKNAPPKTGQTRCSAESSGTWSWAVDCDSPNLAGQDGELQKGKELPTPRFTDNNNGTVTDNLTSLIWLKNANCGGAKNWLNAMAFAADLHDGWTGDGNGGDCGLTDSSSASDWRLPNRNELLSLVHLGYTEPALTNTAGTARWNEGDAFFDVQSYFYWSSTSHVTYPEYAWNVGIGGGPSKLELKSNSTYYVWPVRGGQ